MKNRRIERFCYIVTKAADRAESFEYFRTKADLLSIKKGGRP
jgi:hypothetical protein